MWTVKRRRSRSISLCVFVCCLCVVRLSGLYFDLLCRSIRTYLLQHWALALFRSFASRHCDCFHRMISSSVRGCARVYEMKRFFSSYFKLNSYSYLELSLCTKQGNKKKKPTQRNHCIYIFQYYVSSTAYTYADILHCCHLNIVAILWFSYWNRVFWLFFLFLHWPYL